MQSGGIFGRRHAEIEAQRIAEASTESTPQQHYPLVTYHPVPGALDGPSCLYEIDRLICRWQPIRLGKELRFRSRIAKSVRNSKLDLI